MCAGWSEMRVRLSGLSMLPTQRCPPDVKTATPEVLPASTHVRTRRSIPLNHNRATRPKFCDSAERITADQTSRRLNSMSIETRAAGGFRAPPKPLDIRLNLAGSKPVKQRS